MNMSEKEATTESSAGSPAKKPRLLVEDKSSSKDEPKQAKDDQQDLKVSKDSENGKKENDEDNDVKGQDERDDESKGKEEGSGEGSGEGSDSEGSSEEEESEEGDEGSEEESDDSDSISDEEFSSLLWPTRDGVKHPDPQQQMLNLMKDMSAMRQENAHILEQHAERLKKRKSSEK